LRQNAPSLGIDTRRYAIAIAGILPAGIAATMALPGASWRPMPFLVVGDLSDGQERIAHQPRLRSISHSPLPFSATTTPAKTNSGRKAPAQIAYSVSAIAAVAAATLSQLDSRCGRAPSSRRRRLFNLSMGVKGAVGARSSSRNRPIGSNGGPPWLPIRAPLVLLAHSGPRAWAREARENPAARDWKPPACELGRHGPGRWRSSASSAKRPCAGGFRSYAPPPECVAAANARQLSWLIAARQPPISNAACGAAPRQSTVRGGKLRHFLLGRT